MSSGIAEAGELNLGGEVRLGYDSNVFNRPPEEDDGEIDAAVTRLTIHSQVADELERGSYELNFEPSYFLKSAKRAKPFWNQKANFVGTYHLSPRTSVTLREQFLFIEKLVLAPKETDPAAPPPAVDDPNLTGESRRTIRNTLSLTGFHLLSPRWSANASSSYTLYRYNRDSDSESDAFSGGLGTSYQLTKTVRVGVGGNTSYREFQGKLTPVGCNAGRRTPQSQTVSYSGYGSLSFLFNPTTSLAIQAGPARIESTAHFCNAAGDGFRRLDSTQTTWFAEADLGKRWQHVKATLRYRRQEGLVSGGNTSVNDTLVGRLDWKLARLWSIGGRASWARQEQAVGPETTSWTASVGLKRRFLQRLRGSVSVAYRNQDTAGSGGRDYQSWNVSLGLRYDLDPIRF